jgi:DNA topoisomerase-1
LRVGNDEYARENGSFGLTTLRGTHVRIDGDRMRFTFIGKSGKQISLGVEHPRCARVIKRCRELPGYRLFRYVGDDGELHAIDSDDVNAYLRDVTGEEISAKDFRTWGGTVLFARAAHEAGPGRSERDATKRLNVAVAAVAQMLGNTPAVCRSCYIHPALIDAYRDETFEAMWARAASARPRARLRKDEIVVLAMLRSLARRARATKTPAPEKSARAA